MQATSHLSPSMTARTAVCDACMTISAAKLLATEPGTGVAGCCDPVRSGSAVSAEPAGAAAQ